MSPGEQHKADQTFARTIKRLATYGGDRERVSQMTDQDIRAEFPKMGVFDETEWNPDEIKDAIFEAANAVLEGFDGEYGFGEMKDIMALAESGGPGSQDARDFIEETATLLGVDPSASLNDQAEVTGNFITGLKDVWTEWRQSKALKNVYGDIVPDIDDVFGIKDSIAERLSGLDIAARADRLAIEVSKMAKQGVMDEEQATEFVKNLKSAPYQTATKFFGINKEAEAERMGTDPEYGKRVAKMDKRTDVANSYDKILNKNLSSQVAEANLLIAKKQDEKATEEQRIAQEQKAKTAGADGKPAPAPAPVAPVVAAQQQKYNKAMTDFANKLNELDEARGTIVDFVYDMWGVNIGGVENAEQMYGQDYAEWKQKMIALLSPGVRDGMAEIPDNMPADISAEFIRQAGLTPQETDSTQGETDVADVVEEPTEQEKPKRKPKGTFTPMEGEEDTDYDEESDRESQARMLAKFRKWSEEKGRSEAASEQKINHLVATEVERENSAVLSKVRQAMSDKGKRGSLPDGFAEELNERMTKRHQDKVKKLKENLAEAGIYEDSHTKQKREQAEFEELVNEGPPEQEGEQSAEEPPAEPVAQETNATEQPAEPVAQEPQPTEKPKSRAKTPAEIEREAMDKPAPSQADADAALGTKKAKKVQKPEETKTQEKEDSPAPPVAKTEPEEADSGETPVETALNSIELAKKAIEEENAEHDDKMSSLVKKTEQKHQQVHHDDMVDTLNKNLREAEEGLANALKNETPEQLKQRKKNAKKKKPQEIEEVVDERTMADLARQIDGIEDEIQEEKDRHNQHMKLYGDEPKEQKWEQENHADRMVTIYRRQIELQEALWRKEDELREEQEIEKRTGKAPPAKKPKKKVAPTKDLHERQQEEQGGNERIDELGSLRGRITITGEPGGLPPKSAVPAKKAKPAEKAKSPTAQKSNAVEKPVVRKNRTTAAEPAQTKNIDEQIADKKKEIAAEAKEVARMEKLNASQLKTKVMAGWKKNPPKDQAGAKKREELAKRPPKEFQQTWLTAAVATKDRLDNELAQLEAGKENQESPHPPELKKTPIKEPDGGDVVYDATADFEKAKDKPLRIKVSELPKGTNKIVINASANSEIAEAHIELDSGSNTPAIAIETKGVDVVIVRGGGRIRHIKTNHGDGGGGHLQIEADKKGGIIVDGDIDAGYRYGEEFVMRNVIVKGNVSASGDEHALVDASVIMGTFDYWSFTPIEFRNGAVIEGKLTINPPLFRNNNFNDTGYPIFGFRERVGVKGGSLVPINEEEGNVVRGGIRVRSYKEVGIDDNGGGNDYATVHDLVHGNPISSKEKNKSDLTPDERLARLQENTKPKPVEIPITDKERNSLKKEFPEMEFFYGMGGGRYGYFGDDGEAHSVTKDEMDNIMAEGIIGGHSFAVAMQDKRDGGNWKVARVVTPRTDTTEKSAEPVKPAPAVAEIVRTDGTTSAIDKDGRETKAKHMTHKEEVAARKKQKAEEEKQAVANFRKDFDDETKQYMSKVDDAIAKANAVNKAMKKDKQVKGYIAHVLNTKLPKPVRRATQLWLDIMKEDARLVSNGATRLQDSKWDKGEKAKKKREKAIADIDRGIEQMESNLAKLKDALAEAQKEEHWDGVDMAALKALVPVEEKTDPVPAEQPKKENRKPVAIEARRKNLPKKIQALWEEWQQKYADRTLFFMDQVEKGEKALAEIEQKLGRKAPDDYDPNFPKDDLEDAVRQVGKINRAMSNYESDVWFAFQGMNLRKGSNPFGPEAPIREAERHIKGWESWTHDALAKLQEIKESSGKPAAKPKPAPAKKPAAKPAPAKKPAKKPPPAKPAKKPARDESDNDADKAAQKAMQEETKPQTNESDEKVIGKWVKQNLTGSGEDETLSFEIELGEGRRHMVSLGFGENGIQPLEAFYIKEILPELSDGEVAAIARRVEKMFRPRLTKGNWAKAVFTETSKPTINLNITREDLDSEDAFVKLHNGKQEFAKDLEAAITEAVMDELNISKD